MWKDGVEKEGVLKKIYTGDEKPRMEG